MKKQQIFFLAPANYRSLSQRHQAFANLLALAGYRVIYVNPIASNGFVVNFHKEKANLTVLDLRLPFRAANFPWLQRVVAQICWKILKRKFKIGWRQILWIADPAMAMLALHQWNMVVYDRCDLHGFFPGQKKSAWKSYEQLLFHKADLIFASHQALHEGIPPECSGKALLVGNACNAEIDCRKSSGRLAGANRPIKAVSAGAHFEWVDCRWLKMLAKNPAIELHIAGVGRGKDFEDLIGMPQVHFHGKLSQQELFDLYYRCDVGLIPFKELELTIAVDPIKAYEFAAAGLRVWSTPVPGISGHELVDFCLESEEGANAAIESFSLPANDRRVARWPERLQTILDRMGRLQSD